MKNKGTSIEEEIDALHFEVHSLLSLAKVTNQELKETPWTDIINLVYQAEYIIDLYLVSSSRDSKLVSSMSEIVEQLKHIRPDVHGSTSLPAQDVEVTSKPLVLGTTTQVSHNDQLVGLQEQKTTITNYLLNGENMLDVISIVGMAGVGKTTLASTLYKDPIVETHFDILAWCTVSQSYQNNDVLLSILDQVKESNKNQRSLLNDQELADKICQSLKKRRYLIVLDDLWDTTLWKYLKRYFPNDKGNRVLITTRNRDVAVQIRSKVNEVRELSKESSLELFQKNTLPKEILSKDLWKISKTIVKHCKGLPLSIVIIAGLLSSMERTEQNWNQIAESVSSILLSDPQGKCKAILDLSYNHLPNHMKSCFLYLGSFSMDKKISVKRLIMRWIAEGLVLDTRSESAEDVAKKYIEDLILKSLVIPAKERLGGGVKTLRIHDLLRDFCLEKSKEKHFLTVLDKRSDSIPPLEDPRRLITNGPWIDDLSFSCHSIRSLICYFDMKASVIENGIKSCDMVLLKVFEVNDVDAKGFPNVSSLVHLRYLALGLKGSEITVLPSSISKLRNLQILILRFAMVYPIEVPDFIWDMVKLRQVHISEEASFKADSNRLESSSFLLENLRSLAKARVCFGDSKWLTKLFGLQRLSCVFKDDEPETDDEEDVNYLINNPFGLSFNDHLTSLKIKNAATRKQRFIRTCQLPKSLLELHFTNFYLESNDISDIGTSLAHLEVLKIFRCSVPSGYKWNVGDDDFPNLKVLKLKKLKICEWIASEASFPSLEQLWVEKCKILDEIPLEFGSLLNLRLIYVSKCPPSVDESATNIEKLQHDEGNTKMRMYINPTK